MLKANEFVVGNLEDAVPMTFVMPRTSYEQRALILSVDDKPHALLLEGENRIRHHLVNVRDESSWSGVLIAHVEIEIDPLSVFVDGNYPPLGAVTRHGTVLSVQTRYLAANPAFVGGTIQLLNNLPAGEGNERASFTRWQIVLGEGLAKRVLHQVDVTPEAGR